MKLAYSVKEAAASLGISQTLVRWLIKERRIKAAHIGKKDLPGSGRLIISKAELERYLEAEYKKA